MLAQSTVEPKNEYVSGGVGPSSGGCAVGVVCDQKLRPLPAPVGMPRSWKKRLES